MSDDVETIMTSSKQEPAQLIGDVTPKHLFVSGKDRFIAVIILNDLRDEQLIIPLLDQLITLERPHDFQHTTRLGINR